MNRLFFAVMISVMMSCNSNDSASSNKNDETALAVVDGKSLFKLNCEQCHRPVGDFTGPALAGVEQRWESKKLLHEFIRNSQEVIPRSKYAADLFEKWKQAYMQPFPNLDDAEIDAILQYVNDEAGK